MSSIMEGVLPRAERSFLFSVEIDVPDFERRQISQNPSPVEEISLNFTLQTRCTHYRATEDSVLTFVRHHETAKLPFSDYRLPVDIFSHGDDTLHLYLTGKFEGFGDILNAKTVADEVINQWVQIKEEVNSSSSEKVFPLSVNLVICQMILTRRERRRSMRRAQGMVPASSTAIRKMLKRVTVEEMEVESCVICLEEIGKEGKDALQMPCLHVFHGECIKNWLKRSHCCPTCRFQMPTK